MLLAGHYSLVSEANVVLFGVADCLYVFNSFVLLQTKKSDKWVMCCACNKSLQQHRAVLLWLDSQQQLVAQEHWLDNML